jgi:hypothetical protein
VITVPDVPSGFAQLGLAFGPGTNTFWAKAAAGANSFTANGLLYLVQFDLDAGTGTVIQTYTNFANSMMPKVMRSIDASTNGQFLAGIERNSDSVSVQLFDISNTNAGPLLRDQEVFPTANPNTQFTIGQGQTVFVGDYLFALDVNNGLMAFHINPSYVVPTPAPFSITTTLTNGLAVLTWPTTAGSLYQVESKNAIGDAWQSAAAKVGGTGANLSFSTSATADQSFFRVVAQ